MKMIVARTDFVQMIATDFIRDRLYESNTFANLVGLIMNEEIDIDIENDIITIKNPKGEGYQPIILSRMQYIYNLHEDIIKEVAEMLRDEGNTKHIAKSELRVK